MSRSIKKGPYVESALMKRIVEMNKSGKKNVVKTWSRSSTISRISLATPSPCTMAASMFRSM